MFMDKHISQFIPRLKEAIEIGNSAALKPYPKPIDNIVITGLGGSGIGGKIVSQLVAKECLIPIVINNDYGLPGFANENTLVIACSYSGNTEETLSALEIALEKGAEVACVTSGGKFETIAKEKGLNHIMIPAGNPPRSCLPYSLTQLFYLLNHYGLISKDFEPQLKSSVELLKKEEENIIINAKELAKKLTGKTPVIYAESAHEGVAIRFRQQIDENSKQLCWHHVFPEMNHNELVGWAGGKDEYAVILLRTPDDHPRTQIRMDLSKDIFKKHSVVEEVLSKGENPVERSLYLILFGDWVSYYLSVENKVDPVEVNIIDYLKGELGKV